MKNDRIPSALIAVVMVLVVLIGACSGINCIAGYWVLSGITGLLDSDIVYGPSVGIIRLSGTIMSGSPSVPRQDGIFYSEEMTDIVARANKNDAIKAVVLRVDSPGGSVVGSNEIYEALLELQKPLVVSMGELAASGGYYVSCPAERILANPSTLTGSIGVIAQMPNIGELMDKIGVDVSVIKSGRLKDEGSPFRPMTEEEKAIWQDIIDEAYDQFVGIVADSRQIPENEVRKLADGRVYTGLQAIDLGLVDEEGNLPDAIALAADLGKIKGEPELIELYEPPTLLESFFMSLPGSTHPLNVEAITGTSLRPTLQYLYTGP